VTSVRRQEQVLCTSTFELFFSPAKASSTLSKSFFDSFSASTANWRFTCHCCVTKGFSESETLFHAPHVCSEYNKTFLQATLKSELLYSCGASIAKSVAAWANRSAAPRFIRVSKADDPAPSSQ